LEWFHIHSTGARSLFSVFDIALSIGRDMAEFLEHALSYHIAQEWMTNSDDEDATIRLERAFLTTDVHAKALGIESSGATVSICMIQVRLYGVSTGKKLLWLY
jgi:hypothetical protein